MQIDEKALAGVQISGRTIYKLDERGVNIWSANFQPNSGYSEVEADKAAQAIFGTILAYQAAKPAPASETVGWKLMPTEPPWNVLIEGRDALMDTDDEIDLSTDQVRECYRAMFAAAPAPADPRPKQVEAVAVKALEWQPVALVDGFNWLTIAQADTPFSRYTLDKHDDGRFLRVMFGNRRVGHFEAGEEAAAKAAAQADCEARIRSALVPAPATAPAPTAEMVEAVIATITPATFYHQREVGDLHAYCERTRNTLRAALAAPASAKVEAEGRS